MEKNNKNKPSRNKFTTGNKNDIKGKTTSRSRSSFQNYSDIKKEEKPAAEQREDVIAGRNPVIELLTTNTPVDNIYIQKTDAKSGAILKILTMAREKNLVVKEVTKEKLDSLCGDVAHQGVVAMVAAYTFTDFQKFIQLGESKPLFLIVCDEIEDPHNLGAIIRTADAVGADGVVIPSRRGVGLTASVMKASAGAARHVPIAKVGNINTALKELKEVGAWVYAADMDGESYDRVKFNESVVLVMGSEGKGVSRLVKENCDVIVSLPMNGKVNSLNASVAAGILMYEVARQRR